MKNSTDKPFFVGYLKMPTTLKKFYYSTVFLLGLLTVIVGYSVASQQKSTGPATWQIDATETISGYLTVDPYPVLHRTDPQNDQQIESIMLVQQGKFSADEFALPHTNSMVSVTGFPIRRGGWTMLELASSDDIVAETDSDTSVITETIKPVSLGSISEFGEIIDSKCFLGVMKPGEGKVHRACSEVCLLGGIPAMFVIRDQSGNKFGYLLTRSDGSSASTLVAKRTADIVKISGEMERRGDLIYIKLAENSMGG